MAETYTFFQDLPSQAAETPPGSILSLSILNENGVKATLFRFAPGQELTEHSAGYPAILHFLEGEADLTLGGDAKKARAGTWVYMPAQLAHSLVAKTPVVMLLLLLAGPA